MPSIDGTSAIRERVKRIAAARGWRAIVDRNALLVLCSADHATIVNGGHALIYGSCFRRSADYPLVKCWSGQGMIEATSLVDTMWGNYIFLGIDAAARTITAFREPSGGVPLYYLSCGEGLVLSDDARLLLEAAQRTPAVDWSVILQGLLYPDLRGAATALTGICELIPGEQLTVDAEAPRGVRTTLIWSFERFASAPGPTSFEGCASLVREEVTRCVAAWARLFERPLLELSGGLDSSVVGACLRIAGADASAVTTWAVGGDADERRWARRAAEGLAMPLAEGRADPSRIDLGRSSATGLPRPASRLFLQEIDRLHACEARDRDADALFSGGGGDNVFCHLQSAVPVADRMLAMHSPVAVLGSAMDVATSTGAHLFRVLGRGLGRARRGRSPRAWPEDRRMLSPEMSSPSAPSHSWLARSAKLLPGKQDHLRLLIAAQNHRDGLGRASVVPLVFPLLSQPLIELCLSIPTYRWFAGGRDRAVVRHGFGQDLPSRIVTRRSKGGFDSLADAIYRLHFDEVRSRLADGFLKRAGLIDREVVLRDYRDGEGADRLRVLALLDVETWAASWT